jgi:hypothetical protein
MNLSDPNGTQRPAAAPGLRRPAALPSVLPPVGTATKPVFSTGERGGIEHLRERALPPEPVFISRRSRIERRRNCFQHNEYPWHITLFVQVGWIP